jgi:hypothetical protein
MGGSQSYPFNKIERPNRRDCKYYPVKFKYDFPENENQCKNGDDNSIGNYVKQEYQEAKNTPCIGDITKYSEKIYYQQNCPCIYGGSEKLSEVETRQYAPIDLTGVTGVTNTKAPTTIYGTKRINGGNVASCPLFVAPFSAASNTKTLQDSQIQVGENQSLFNIVVNGNPTTNPTTVGNVEHFTSDMNNTLENNAKLLNIFNDAYYSYVYKCQGDEENQKKMLQIFKTINNNPTLTYDKVIEIIGQIEPSRTVVNTVDNKLDCATLKETLLKFNHYNNNEYISRITNLTKYDVYDSKHKKIIDDYKTLNVERNSLDQKLRDLYNIPGYNSSNSKLEFDSTIYTGIIITIVASSLVYYAFTKL